MFSRNARRHALWLSLCFTALVQLPVVTAESAGTCPIKNCPSSPQLSSLGTVSETSTVFDADEKLWKRWSLSTDASGNRVLRLATSADGNNWATVDAPCFTPSAGGSAWDHSAISSPVVLLNPDAQPDRKFMLWYSGSNNDTLHAKNAIPSTKVGLAFSADGRKFARIPAAESPYSADGLVLTAESVFPGEAVTGGSIGEPKVMLEDGKYTMSFYRVATDNSGEVNEAGLGKAVSSDGIKWTVETASPVTVQLVGHTTTTPALVQRLRQLVDAYSECPM